MKNLEHRIKKFFWKSFKSSFKNYGKISLLAGGLAFAGACQGTPNSMSQDSLGFNAQYDSGLGTSSDETASYSPDAGTPKRIDAKALDYVDAQSNLDADANLDGAKPYSPDAGFAERKDAGVERSDSTITDDPDARASEETDAGVDEPPGDAFYFFYDGHRSVRQYFVSEIERINQVELRMKAVIDGTWDPCSPLGREYEKFDLFIENEFNSVIAEKRDISICDDLSPDYFAWAEFVFDHVWHDLEPGETYQIYLFYRGNALSRSPNLGWERGPSGDLLYRIE